MQPIGLLVQSHVASKTPSLSRKSTTFTPESLTLAYPAVPLSSILSITAPFSSSFTPASYVLSPSFALSSIESIPSIGESPHPDTCME